MELLSLDDKRWLDLDHRNWRNGSATPGSGAPFVPEELAKLLEDPANKNCFTDLWPWLCSEGDTYAAAYAALPYFVACAERLSPQERVDFLIVIGLIVAESKPDAGKPYRIEPYLLQGYKQAMNRAKSLLAEALLVDNTPADTRYLLGAVAALQGHVKLARVLQNLDCVACDACGEHPAELQEALG